MRFILFVLLFLSFAYALGLVLANNTEVGVNLLFSQAPAMNLGLLLILCMTLGIVIGLLLALLLFRVLQNKWEISQLKKSNAQLQDQLTQANVVIERQSNVPTVDEAGYPASSVSVDGDTSHSSTSNTTLLSKHQRD